MIYDYFDLTGGKARVGRRCSTATTSRSIVWGKDSALAALLDRSPDWERVHRDATDAVWVRR